MYLKMVYGYIRVFTDKQTVENQRFEIERFCKKEGLTIDGWIEETISGTKNYNKRALGKLLNRIVKDDLVAFGLLKIITVLAMIFKVKFLPLLLDCQQR